MHNILEIKLLCEKMVGFVRYFEQQVIEVEISIRNFESLAIERQCIESLTLKIDIINSCISRLKEYISFVVLEITEQYPEFAEVFVEVFQTHFQLQSIDQELNISQIYINDSGLLREFKLIN